MNMGIDIRFGGGEKRDGLRDWNQLPRRGIIRGHGGRAIFKWSESVRKVVDIY